ncbi:MAG: bifunctional adenosylcobinamide kinase/adenosylcobinamide-phosphate guanylyltransferase [Actinomycetota bacterium]|nr:bifunctional adenosylcobinamide kinase/adenosylcobinamide-phosphate guanylyltransferase [Actinomycetota bacterium]MDQ3353966.1 bifunctional adenosylcobinamide kinase/adenosylcobinamide-phosphate guanylyltransferase [Actinomycetota bacterium]
MITLVLGGARSGKSVVAERLASRLPAPVTYLATTMVDPADDDLADRIATHTARRPAPWATIETSPSTLTTVLRTTAGTVLVDSLGAWAAAHPDMAVDITDLCDALRTRDGDSVVVSDEVGLGVHPSSEVGRHFRDVLGQVNQAVATVAGEVLLVVAGRTLSLTDVPPS